MLVAGVQNVIAKVDKASTKNIVSGVEMAIGHSKGPERLMINIEVSDLIRNVCKTLYLVASRRILLAKTYDGQYVGDTFENFN